MAKRNIIVVGASSGGVDALKVLIAGIPPEFNATLFIVWHMSAQVQGILPQVLGSLNDLPASHAIDLQPFEPRHIYIAPPDHHMMIEKGRLRVTRGPRENRFRPAVDPLFRSAALAYGSSVIGVVLSGALDDGTAGLQTIKQLGGITIVQDPADAEASGMPLSALRKAVIDYRLPVAEIPALLTELSVQDTSGEQPVTSPHDREIAQAEVRIARDESPMDTKYLQETELSPYTCPDCHGVLSRLREGDTVRFRCHTGHAFSLDGLQTFLLDNIGQDLWSAVRGLDEAILLLNELGDYYSESNIPMAAAIYFQKAQESETLRNTLRQIIASNELLQTGQLEKVVQQVRTPQETNKVRY